MFYLFLISFKSTPASFIVISVFVAFQKLLLFCLA